jgi:hypothetical protein
VDGRNKSGHDVRKIALKVFSGQLRRRRENAESQAFRPNDNEPAIATNAVSAMATRIDSRVRSPASVSTQRTIVRMMHKMPMILDA